MTLDFDSLPVFDHHCHPFPIGRIPEVLENTWTLSLNKLPVADITNSAYFQMSVRAMCKYHGIAGHEEVLRVAKEKYLADPQGYTASLWKDANLAGLIADIGSPITNKRLTPAELAEFSELNKSIDVYRINRLENMMDDLIKEKLPFQTFIQRFLSDMEEQVKTQNLVALKSVIAYRTGLDVKPLPLGEVLVGYETYLADPLNKKAEKIIRDHIFLIGADLCRQLHIPLQIHTGAGDSPLCNMLINEPLLLYDAINDPRCKDTVMVMVHAGNPIVEHAAYLVAQYPNLYMDVSSLVPYFGHAIEDKLKTILAYAPFNKVMYGSDGSGIPDHLWFGAKYFKKVLGKVLGELVEGNIISEEYALEAAKMMLTENAKRIYNLG